MERDSITCSATCSELATWEFGYKDKTMPNRSAKMLACGNHRAEINRAVSVMARQGTASMRPMGNHTHV